MSAWVTAWARAVGLLSEGSTAGSHPGVAGSGAEDFEAQPLFDSNDWMLGVGEKMFWRAAVTTREAMEQASVLGGCEREYGAIVA